MDSQELIDMLELIRDKDYAIDSITIIRNGYLVTDVYLYPFQKATSHIIHSCTKSINSALVGIALDKGFIKSVDQPVLEFFPEKTIANLTDQKKSLTLENLLTMSSGLDTRDSWIYEWKGLAKMMNSEDWVQYVLDLPMANAPGKSFEYSNNVSYLISAIVHKATKMSPLAFAEEYLFGPLGITGVEWPADPEGINLGYGQMMLKPHDMAKFGLLYLNKGRWDKKQIVSKTWVESSTRRHISSNTFDGYGYQWWSGSALYNMDILLRLKWRFGWKQVYSDNYYMAVGKSGQFIFVVPDKNMVVVFTSNLEGSDFFIPKALLDEYIIPAAVSSKPLAVQPEKKQTLDSLSANFAKAPPNGIIWTTRENGVAKDGEFIRTASPSFRFRYPKTSRKQKIIRSGQAAFMKTMEERLFSANIRKIPADSKLELTDVGTKGHAASFRSIGTNVQVISSKMIKLEDATPANRTDINWTSRDHWKLRTLIVSSLKDGNLITLLYSFLPLDDASNQKALEEGKAIVESLTFK